MNFNPKPFIRLLNKYLASQTEKIEAMIDSTLNRASVQASHIHIGKGEDFFFRNYPALSKMVDRMLKELSKSITETIVAGCEWSWDLANVMNDDLLASILASIGANRVPKDVLDKWRQKNLGALEAFQRRKVNGMGLSQRVWKYTGDIKGDLELALDLGLGQGESADRLSRDVRKYLREPDRLYRRVRDEKGILRLSKSASNYHPGQGVYRSSYKNARRLTATETNMAYRHADHARHQQVGFILGIRVNLSNNHTCLDSQGIPRPFYDICDILQGPYPKDFLFSGWHPLCRCYTTTILPDRREFFKYLDSMDENGVSTYKFSNQVDDVPPQFKQWVSDNEARITDAEARGKLPYFLRDNEKYWKGTIKEPSPLEKNNSEIAKALGIKKGKPMSYEDANTGRENPRYSEGGAYRVNCQTCTITHELRRRGFDVEAKPNVNNSAFEEMKKHGVTWRERFLNQDGTKSAPERAYKWMRGKNYSRMSEKRTFEFLRESISAEGRYEIYCKWRTGTAHVFLAEKTGKSIRYFDPQTGSQDVSSYIKRMDMQYTEILRIDDKLINPKILGIISPKGVKKQ